MKFLVRRNGSKLVQTQKSWLLNEDKGEERGERDYLAWGKPSCDEEVQLVAQEASMEGMVAGIATGEGRRRVCNGERSS